MRIRRLIKTILLLFLILVILAGAIIFGLVDRVPEDYRIAITRVRLLGEINKPGEDPRRDFKLLLGDFSKEVGKGEPFWFTISADEVNLCLASMDEIASYYPTSRPIRPSPILEKVGFTGPVVAMDNGVLTLMAWSMEYRKVISVDVGFIFDGVGKVRMKILALRVGLMPVPRFCVDKLIIHFRQRIQKLIGRFGDDRKNQRDDVRKIMDLLRALANMLDGKPVRTKMTWKIGAPHRVLIDTVEITDGVMRLHFSPEK